MNEWTLLKVSLEVSGEAEEEAINLCLVSPSVHHDDDGSKFLDTAFMKDIWFV